MLSFGSSTTYISHFRLLVRAVAVPQQLPRTRVQGLTVVSTLSTSHKPCNTSSLSPRDPSRKVCAIMSLRFVVVVMVAAFSDALEISCWEIWAGVSGLRFQVLGIRCWIEAKQLNPIPEDPKPLDPKA